MRYPPPGSGLQAQCRHLKWLQALPPHFGLGFWMLGKTRRSWRGKQEFLSVFTHVGNLPSSLQALRPEPVLKSVATLRRERRARKSCHVSIHCRDATPALVTQTMWSGSSRIFKHLHKLQEVREDVLYWGAGQHCLSTGLLVTSKYLLKVVELKSLAGGG